MGGDIARGRGLAAGRPRPGPSSPRTGCRVVPSAWRGRASWPG